MEENNNFEEREVLIDMEKKFDIPKGFLIEIIGVEREQLFQLKRRNIIKKIEKIIADFVEEYYAFTKD